MPWLLKSEPDTYSWDQFAQDKKATWDGVANVVALKNMRSMKKGDLCLFYHTGKEKRVVGVAEVTREAYPDPKEKDEKLVVVDLKVKRKLKTPVGLDVIKLDKAFAGWDLIRISRLSVVPTSEAMFARVEALSEE